MNETRIYSGDKLISSEGFYPATTENHKKAMHDLGIDWYRRLTNPYELPVLIIEEYNGRKEKKKSN